MDNRMVGHTGLEVSVIGFGAMTIGGVFGPVDDNESIHALNTAAAVAAGIRTTEKALQNAAFGRALPAELFQKLRNLLFERENTWFRSKL